MDIKEIAKINNSSPSQKSGTNSNDIIGVVAFIFIGISSLVYFINSIKLIGVSGIYWVMLIANILVFGFCVKGAIGCFKSGFFDNGIVDLSSVALIACLSNAIIFLSNYSNLKVDTLLITGIAFLAGTILFGLTIYLSISGNDSLACAICGVSFIVVAVLDVAGILISAPLDYTLVFNVLEVAGIILASICSFTERN